MSTSRPESCSSDPLIKPPLAHTQTELSQRLDWDGHNICDLLFRSKSPDNRQGNQIERVRNCSVIRQNMDGSYQTDYNVHLDLLCAGYITHKHTHIHPNIICIANQLYDG